MKISNETLSESYRKFIEFLFVIGKYIRISVHPYRYTVQKKFLSNIFSRILSILKVIFIIMHTKVMTIWIPL
jgi:hypothetical protein